MALWSIVIGGKGQCRHSRAQIRSADPDIDDIGNTSPLPDKITTAHRLGKIAHHAQGLQHL